MENAAESTISSSSMPSSSPTLETIVVVSGANATATAAQGSSPSERSNNGSQFVIMDFINLYLQFLTIWMVIISWWQFLVLWTKIIFESLRRVIANITQEVTPTMGLAFLALSIQNIYQIKFSQGLTHRDNKLQKINGSAVVLLLSGLLMPRHAGGHIAMTIGVILVSGSAATLAFR